MLYAEDGGTIRNATWQNLRISFYDYLGEFKSGRAFDFMLHRRNGLSQLHAVQVQNVVTDVVCSSHFVGVKGFPLTNVTFTNVTMNVREKNHVAKSETPFLFDCGHNVGAGVVMQGLQVAWHSEASAWRGISQAHPGHGVPIQLAFPLCAKGTGQHH